MRVTKYFAFILRIGRTGRGNANGWATTLINNSVEEAVLLDLKHLLIEAKQKVTFTLGISQNVHVLDYFLAFEGASIPCHTPVGARKVLGNYGRRQGLLVLWRSRSQNHQLPQAGCRSAQEDGGRRQEGLPRGEFGRLLTCILCSKVLYFNLLS